MLQTSYELVRDCRSCNVQNFLRYDGSTIAIEDQKYDDATKDTSWLVSYENHWTNQHYLTEPWMFEQYTYASHYGIFSVGVYGTDVTSYKYLYDNLKTSMCFHRGADITSAKYSSLYSFNDDLAALANSMSSTTVDLADAFKASAGYVKDAMHALHGVLKEEKEFKFHATESIGVALKKEPSLGFMGVDVGYDYATEVLSEKAIVVSETKDHTQMFLIQLCPASLLITLMITSQVAQ